MPWAKDEAKQHKYMSRTYMDTTQNKDTQGTDPGDQLKNNKLYGAAPSWRANEVTEAGPGARWEGARIKSENA